MLGLAVDSQFASNHYVYLLYTYDARPARHARRARARWSRSSLRVTDQHRQRGDRGDRAARHLHERRLPGARATRVDCIPSDGLSHSIGTVRSAPDGTLWVGNGDAASFSTVDPLAFRTYDEQSSPARSCTSTATGWACPATPSAPSNSQPDARLHEAPRQGLPQPVPLHAAARRRARRSGTWAGTRREEIDLIGRRPARATAGPATRARSHDGYGTAAMRAGVRQGGHARRNATARRPTSTRTAARRGR